MAVVTGRVIAGIGGAAMSSLVSIMITGKQFSFVFSRSPISHFLILNNTVNLSSKEIH